MSFSINPQRESGLSGLEKDIYEWGRYYEEHIHYARIDSDNNPGKTCRFLLDMLDGAMFIIAGCIQEIRRIENSKGGQVIYLPDRVRK